MNPLALTLACVLAFLMGPPPGTLAEGDWEVASLAATATCALLTLGAHWVTATIPAVVVVATLAG